MPNLKPQSRHLTKASDDLSSLLEEQRRDPQFLALEEDALLRSRVVAFFRDLRVMRRWSQKDLARRMRTAQSAISEFEKGITEPRLSTIQRCARAFGYRLELQVWNGPLLVFDSWSERSFHYATVYEDFTVRDGEPDQWCMFFKPVGGRVPVSVDNVHVRVQVQDSPQFFDPYVQTLSYELDAVSG
jgi:transcriptional regulator with XRE-family HTH domain